MPNDNGNRRIVLTCEGHPLIYDKYNAFFKQGGYADA